MMPGGGLVGPDHPSGATQPTFVFAWAALMVQFGEAQAVFVTTTDPSALAQLMVKHAFNTVLKLQFTTGAHGVWLLSGLQLLLNNRKLQPIGALDAAAGDARLSTITGAVHATTPAAALALIRSRRLRPRRSVPAGSVTATSQPLHAAVSACPLNTAT